MTFHGGDECWVSRYDQVFFSSFQVKSHFLTCKCMCRSMCIFTPHLHHSPDLVSCNLADFLKMKIKLKDCLDRHPPPITEAEVQKDTTRFYLRDIKIASALKAVQSCKRRWPDKRQQPNINQVRPLICMDLYSDLYYSPA